jgi:hypothetical protein
MDQGPRYYRQGRHVAAIALALYGALALPSAAAERIAPPAMHLTSGGKTVRATQGTYCWERTDPGGETGTSLCADYAYPLQPPCKLPARAGAKLKVNLHAKARSIFVALAMPSQEEDIPFAISDWQRSKRSARGKSVWRFRLPSEVENAIAVDISTSYPQGDSNTWTGLRTGSCRSNRGEPAL